MSELTKWGVAWWPANFRDLFMLEHLRQKFAVCNLQGIIHKPCGHGRGWPPLGVGEAVCQMSILPYFEKWATKGEGVKMSTKLSTWFMDDPDRVQSPTVCMHVFAAISHPTTLCDWILVFLPKMELNWNSDNVITIIRNYLSINHFKAYRLHR